jgi:hypothetical protein
MLLKEKDNQFVLASSYFKGSFEILIEFFESWVSQVG